LVGVGSAGNQNADMEVPSELHHVVTSTVGLGPTLALKYGGIGGIGDVFNMFTIGEELCNNSTDAILERN